MKSISNIAFSVGVIMFTLNLINYLSIQEVTPSLQRSEVISALTSIAILLIGFLTFNNHNNRLEKVHLNDALSKCDLLYLSTFPSKVWKLLII